MSREIKFRGQTRRKGELIINMAGDKCEANWVYGGIFPQNSGGDFAIIYEQTSCEKRVVYADTVGQYIGVDDKNGKEIYEDDIVRTNSGRICKVVRFSSTQYQGWDLEPIEAKNPPPKEQELWKDLEAIGNVYENADLLEGGGQEMSKSILVIDAQDGCIRCDCCHTKDYDFRERIDGEKICGIENMNVDDYCDGINLRKPDWCPLLDLPEKKPRVKYHGNGCFGINEAMKNSFNLGFNACIDEILKGGELG